MAASTITRDTWVNDTGSAATPAGDGTLLTNTVLQDHIYARIDAMFAGAGSYATFTFGGLVAAEGFGTHLLSAGGTGGNKLEVRNSTAGTGNFGRVQVRSDTVSAFLDAYSSTFTSSLYQQQSSALLYTDGSGGLDIAAAHATTGVIRFWSAGNERVRFTAAGSVLIGDTANTDVTLGLTINQAANDDTILALKSSDVAHALGSEETDTFGSFQKVDGGLGGLHISGYSEATSGAAVRVFAQTATGSGDTTKSAVGAGYIDLRAFENETSVGANDNLLVIRNGNATAFIFDAEGDMHYDGAAPANYDRWDDLALLRTLDLVCAGPDLIESAWDRFVQYNRADLVRAGILSEGGFVNLTKHTRLINGGIWQLFTRVKELEARLDAVGA